MNETGHQAVAKVVNHQIGDKFPLNWVLTGSTDPDTGNVSRYTGDESKHHYDSGTAGGRPHDASSIVRVVWRHTEHARRCWLSGKTAAAAFHFGVASHFLLDGFIVSPGQNPEAHARGDRAFAAKACKLRAKAVQSDPHADRSSAENALAGVSPAFSATDPRAVPSAVEALTKMGLAVTAARAPQAYVDAGQAACARLQGRLAAILGSYQADARRIAGRHDEVLAGAADTVSEGSPFIRHSLAVRAAYLHLGRRSLSLGSRVGCLAFRLFLRAHLSPTGLPTDLPHRRRTGQHDFADARSEFRAEVERIQHSWRDQGGWFDLASDAREWGMKSKEHSGSWLREESSITASARQACRKTIEAQQCRLQVPALQELPQWWTRTLRGKIGEEMRLRPQEFIAFCCGVTLVPLLVLAVLGLAWYGWTPAAAVAVAWALATALEVGGLCHCRALSSLVRTLYRATCPKCSHQTLLWAGALSGKAAPCPCCGVPLKVEQLEQVSIEELGDQIEEGEDASRPRNPPGARAIGVIGVLLLVSPHFATRCGCAGPPISAPAVWRRNLSSPMVASEVSDHDFFSEADLPESHGCPNLFLPNYRSRHVKSARCQAADARQGQARCPPWTRGRVRGRTESSPRHHAAARGLSPSCVGPCVQGWATVRAQEEILITKNDESRSRISQARHAAREREPRSTSPFTCPP